MGSVGGAGREEEEDGGERGGGQQTSQASAAAVVEGGRPWCGVACHSLTTSRVRSCQGRDGVLSRVEI